MKTATILLSLIFAFAFASAQDKYMTKTGHIRFYSHTPMEDIDGNNHQAGSIFDVKTGEIVFNALIKSFEFSRALMQEHFNENYMESDKIPNAKFKGQVLNIKDVDLKKDGDYPVDVKGDLNIHGVVKNVTVKANLQVKGGKLTGTSKFNVTPGDYNIIIPSVVREKIAKELEVTVEMNYEPLNK
jgi:polyisoprenoid-binding protein YceI